VRDATSEARRPNLASLLSNTDNAGDHLRRAEQGLRSPVSVALGHARLGAPKKALDHVKRYALVHQEAGERMAQIEQADITDPHGAGCGSTDRTDR
jgi:hypothetical protein